MKRVLINLSLMVCCLLAIAACDNKKGNKVIDEEGNARELVDDDYDDSDADEDAPDTDVDFEADGDDVEADGDDVDGDASWEDEVWTTFGGTYFFFGDGQSLVLEFPLINEEGPVKLSYDDGEYEATVNEETGLIVAHDDAGKEVFRGAVYAGGNLIKGTFKGQEIKLWGSGD